MIVTLLACVTFMSAYDFEVDGIYYEYIKEEEGNVSVVPKDSWTRAYKGDIIIPSVVEHEGVTYNVTRVGDYAFKACEELTSVIIPNSVTRIGSLAFGWCTSLKKMYLPNSITSIGESAFTNCYNLTQVSMPNSVTSIGEGAFDECFCLSSITLPENLTLIEDYLFARCTSLKTINIPSGVTSIGELAFFDTSLTSVIIPDGCTSLGFGAFDGCAKLNSIKLPQQLVSIGERVFLGCDQITTIDVPESVVEIGPMAFAQCSSLASINIPKGITKIERQVFYKCCSLTSIDLPDGITSIGSHAFAGCDGLTTIIIPEAVVSIEDGAFGYNSGLRSLDLPKGITCIGNYAFRSCKNLTFVGIPEGVISIGGSAFTDCNQLRSITLPPTITTIEDYAFQCPHLDVITCYAPTPPRVSENTFLTYGQLHVPSGCKEAYEAADYWKNFDIEDDLNSVELGQSNYTESIIPDYNNCFIFSLQESVLSISGYYAGNPNYKTKLDYSINGHDIYLNMVSELDEEGNNVVDMQPLTLDVAMEGCNEDYYYIYLTGYSGKTAIVDDYTLHETSYKGYGVRAFVREKPPKTDISTGQKDPNEKSDVDVVCRVRGMVGGHYQQHVSSIEGNVIYIDGTYSSQAEGDEDVEATTPLGQLPAGDYTIVINVKDMDDVMPPFSATLTFKVTPTSVEVTSIDGAGDVIINLQGHRVSHATEGIYIKNGRKILIQ
jgi:hypothetical protein